MKNSELGSTPHGWDINLVGDLVKRLSPNTRYKRKDVNESGKIPVIPQSQENIMGFHDHEPDFKASSGEPIIVFGDHTCKMELMIKPFSVGPNVVPFVSCDNQTTMYLFYLTQDLLYTQEYKRHWTTLKNKKVILAPEIISTDFSRIIRPLLEQRDILFDQNQCLNQTLNLLLPNLISGDIEVNTINR